MIDKEWCEFFKQIEENPKALVKGLTFRHLLLARQHVDMCKECENRMNRVVNNNPDKPNEIGFNVN